jgi:hypothetical protein
MMESGILQVSGSEIAAGLNTTTIGTGTGISVKTTMTDNRGHDHDLQRNKSGIILRNN